MYGQKEAGSEKKTRPAKKTKAAVPLAAAIAETIEKGPQTLDMPKFVRDAQAVIPDSNEGLAETVTMTEIKTENKLSAKTLVGKAVSDVKELTRLYSVIGIATGIKTGESLYGPWTHCQVDLRRSAKATARCLRRQWCNAGSSQ